MSIAFANFACVSVIKLAVASWLARIIRAYGRPRAYMAVVSVIIDVHIAPRPNFTQRAWSAIK